VTWIFGDLEDLDALERLTQGADVIIHAAGLIKARRPSDFLRVNEAGAARVAGFAGDRLILISSLAAREPQLSDYAASKRAGEIAALAVLGARLTILRPPALYGPGNRATLGLFQLAASSPILPVPAAPAARLALAYVDDVAQEICAAAESELGGGRFALGGAKPEGYGWPEIMATAAKAVGRRPRPVSLPLSLVTAAGAAADLWSRLSGQALIFGPGKARELAHPDWSVSFGELGPWATPDPPTDLEAGFAQTVAWYRAAEWL
jgi:nucleoside-diphosphate-sugar epimerase